MTNYDNNQGQDRGMQSDQSDKSRGGNFADNPERAREAGRKGGQSRGNKDDM
jgi:general stress protein YciG